LQANAICNPNRDGCVPTAPCGATDGGTPRCLPLAPQGSACDANTACEPALTCTGPNGATTCQPSRGFGQSCVRHQSNSNCGEGTCVTNTGPVYPANGFCLGAAQLFDYCGNGQDNGFAPCSFCFSCINNMCVERGKAGAPCSADSLCLDTDFYFCNGGFCALRPRVGEACTAAMDGERGNCLYADNFCQKSAPGTAGVCAQVPDDAGLPCGVRYDVFPDCPNDQYCMGPTDAGVGVCTLHSNTDQPCYFGNPPPFGLPPAICRNLNDFCDARPDAGAVGTMGLCHPRVAAGQVCSNTALSVLCALGTFCNSYDVTDGGLTFCELPRADGAACVDGDQCASDWCPADGGGCSQRRPAGAPCLGDGECASRGCDAATSTCVAVCSSEVISNEAGGCMSYDLRSLSSYIFFSLVLLPALRRKRGDRLISRKK
jgi:hypothetical protein